MNRLPLSAALIPETMSRLAYFQSWPDDVLDRLAVGAKLLTLPKNGWLARKGEMLDCLYVVVSGLLRLYIPLPNNMERVIALVSPGDSLGESCLVLNEACPYHAVAGKDSHLLAIDGLVYRRELNRHPVLTSQTLELVSRRLMETLRDTEICAQRSSVQRVACFLMLHQPSPQSHAFKFRLPARKQDIAAKLGLTQETFSRVLGFLDKQGLIQMKGGQISVEDGQRLTQITSMREAKEPGTETGI
jgi:CRP-like cAMP-binding protein